MRWTKAAPWRWLGQSVDELEAKSPTLTRYVKELLSNDYLIVMSSNKLGTLLKQYVR